MQADCNSEVSVEKIFQAILPRLTVPITNAETESRTKRKTFEELFAVMFAKW